LDFDFTGPDVALEFLDLVVKHELEFLEFLGFLLQIEDS
jgi:hypothetical protein